MSLTWENGGPPEEASKVLPLFLTLAPLCSSWGLRNFVQNSVEFAMAFSPSLPHPPSPITFPVNTCTLLKHYCKQVFLIQLVHKVYQDTFCVLVYPDTRAQICLTHTHCPRGIWRQPRQQDLPAHVLSEHLRVSVAHAGRKNTMESAENWGSSNSGMLF